MQSWSVSVHESADLRPVRKHAPALLNELTGLGIARFGAGHPQLGGNASVEILTQQLGAVGVVEGVAVPSVRPPRLIASSYGSGSIDPMNVTTAVEAELEKPDNRRKLGVAPAGVTRHLFVWLHDSNWYVSSAVRDSDFPLPPAPCLPPEVDIAWVAVAEGRPPTVSVLLRIDAFGIAAIDLITGAAVEPGGGWPAEGPPCQPSPCPICGSLGKWVDENRTRVDPTTGEKSVITAWDAVCSVNETHYRFLGRLLSKRELKSLGNPT